MNAFAAAKDLPAVLPMSSPFLSLFLRPLSCRGPRKARNFRRQDGALP